MRPFPGFIAAVALFLAGPAVALPSMSLKLTGGIAYLLNNDYNTGGQGIYDYYRLSYGGASGQFNPLRLGLNAGGEVAVSLGRGLSLGVGVSYVRYTRASEFGYEWSFFSSQETLKPTLELIPLTLNIHLESRAGQRLKSDLFAGVGYYFLRFDHEWDVQTNFFSYETSQTFASKTGTLGIQGGVGLEFEVGAHVALVFQTTGQFVSFPEVKGRLTETGSWFNGQWQDETSEAYLWYFERRESGNVFAQIIFSAAEPSQTEYPLVRKGRLNLSGISASAGLKFVF